MTVRENTNAPPAAWWKSFKDPELEKLIDEAAHENYSLQIATLRVRQARYQRNIAAGYLAPTIDANAGYLRGYGSQNVKLPFGSGGGDPPDPAGVDANDDAFENELTVLGKGGFPGIWTDLYQVGLDATWEIDVFGGLRRRVQSANAQMQAEVETRRSLMITVFAEVEHAKACTPNKFPLFVSCSHALTVLPPLSPSTNFRSLSVPCS